MGGVLIRVAEKDIPSVILFCPVLLVPWSIGLTTEQDDQEEERKTADKNGLGHYEAMGILDKKVVLMTPVPEEVLAASCRNLREPSRRP